MTDADRDAGPTNRITDAFERVREHAFHPVDEDSFTVDRELGEHGIADLDDGDWRVRLLAVRDLVRAGTDAVGEIAAGFADDDVQVRTVAATALGVLRADGAVPALERVVREDPDPLARSAATVALGRIGAEGALDLLRDRAASDGSKDVRHQAELAVDRIGKGAVAEDELAEAFRSLDPDDFGRRSAGDEAPEFSLPTVEGEEWALSDHVGDGWTVLIWVFADWCPVCHREFDELIELREAFAEADVSVATVECHERYRGSVMVGRELEPEYWFADEPFVEAYTEQVWWPHLLDRAGAVGARYGVDPMAFAVHAEYINRPATVVIDPSGTVRFAYYGTFWGDRPSVAETLEMIRTGEFAFEHEERRKPPAEKTESR
ncbi:redoxin domain-containing protein [Haloparvum sedimenti]|uniref:redoxin domain-containing protein n=1 Tax=Haloparvum sedimenti TaxID=1678448 RepID=UPI00071E92C4|nr:redoxin domain-containing protein [Haloparvum sedimenti]